MVTGTASISGVSLSIMTVTPAWAFVWICQARAAGLLRSMAAGILLGSFNYFSRMTGLISPDWMWPSMTIPGSWIFGRYFVIQMNRSRMKDSILSVVFAFGISIRNLKTVVQALR